MKETSVPLIKHQTKQKKKNRKNVCDDGCEHKHKKN